MVQFACMWGYMSCQKVSGGLSVNFVEQNCPDSKVREANMGPTWGQRDPGGPHVGPMSFAWAVLWLANGYAASGSQDSFMAIIC